MGRNGFSLIEMMVVVALMGILLAIATLSFNDFSRKSRIEGQVKTLYSDLANVRSEAMFRRAGRFTQITPNLFSVYSSNSLLGQPVRTTILKNTVVTNESEVRFNERGLLVDADGLLLDHSIFICISGDNSAGLDSIIIGMANIQMGKRNGACDQASITTK